MTVSLRNTSGEPLHLGSPEGRFVEVDEIVPVEGSILKGGPDDAYVIGQPTSEPGDPPADDASDKARADYADKVAAHNAALATHRAYPKSIWTATGGKPAKSEGDES